MIRPVNAADINVLLYAFCIATFNVDGSSSLQSDVLFLIQPMLELVTMEICASAGPRSACIPILGILLHVCQKGKYSQSDTRLSLGTLAFSRFAVNHTSSMTKYVESRYPFNARN